MKQSINYNNSPKATIIVAVPALEQPSEIKNGDYIQMKANTNNNGQSTHRESPKEGHTKPPIPQSSPTTQSMQLQGTIPAAPQNVVLPTASSWDAFNGRDVASPPALPKDFVFAQPQALPPRDGPRK